MISFVSRDENSMVDLSSSFFVNVYQRVYGIWMDMSYMVNNGLLGGAISPSWKMMDFVNGKDDIPARDGSRDGSQVTAAGTAPAEKRHIAKVSWGPTIGKLQVTMVWICLNGRYISDTSNYYSYALKTNVHKTMVYNYCLYDIVITILTMFFLNQRSHLPGGGTTLQESVAKKLNGNPMHLVDDGRWWWILNPPKKRSKINMWR